MHDLFDIDSGKDCEPRVGVVLLNWNLQCSPLTPQTLRISHTLFRVELFRSVRAGEGTRDFSIFDDSVRIGNSLYPYTECQDRMSEAYQSYRPVLGVLYT